MIVVQGPGNKIVWLMLTTVVAGRQRHGDCLPPALLSHHRDLSLVYYVLSSTVAIYETLIRLVLSRV